MQTTFVSELCGPKQNYIIRNVPCICCHRLWLLSGSLMQRQAHSFSSEQSRPLLSNVYLMSLRCFFLPQKAPGTLWRLKPVSLECIPEYISWMAEEIYYILTLSWTVDCVQRYGGIVCRKRGSVQDFHLRLVSSRYLRAKSTLIWVKLCLREIYNIRQRGRLVPGGLRQEQAKKNNPVEKWSVGY